MRLRVLVWACVTLLAGIEYSVIRVTEAAEWFKPFNVSYDHRALVVDGNRRILISAGIHYPRATPEVSLYSLLLSLKIQPILYLSFMK